MRSLGQQTACASRIQPLKLFDVVPKRNISSHKSVQERKMAILKLPLEKNRVMPTEVSVASSSTTTTNTTTQAIPILNKSDSFSSCKDVPSKDSGAYQIRLKSDSEPFKVYCEQTAFSGGWIVIQYRYDGSLDFYRGWNEFRDGFGDLNKEFWLGLEKVHQITTARKHELVIELKDFDRNYIYAQYDAFEVGSESEGYVLKHLDSFNGNASDSMSHSVGMMFTTKDRDNDDDSIRQCAHYQGGAWWHGSCTSANLNGPYIDAVDQKSMFWWYYKRNVNGLSFSRMMIRELE
ncbi:fibrinogen C domain-containing protein 1-like [Anopheles darlingi]|uniref:fibrinogen C domain-containing protein 1-like n=1 Tax=Anopheles darlingi TaxID=43151 RepID=UPI0021002045|nr:fibrinogen C domain-containing protein 1-like [Anopheles darlingi]